MMCKICPRTPSGHMNISTSSILKHPSLTPCLPQATAVFLFSQVSEAVPPLNPLQSDASTQHSRKTARPWLPMTPQQLQVCCRLPCSRRPPFVSRIPHPLGSPPTSLAIPSQSAFHPKIVSWGSISSPLTLPYPWTIAPLASTRTRHPEAPPSPRLQLRPPPAAVPRLSTGHPHPLLGGQHPPEVVLTLTLARTCPLPQDGRSPSPAEFSSFNSVQLVPSSVPLPLLWVKPLTSYS